MRIPRKKKKQIPKGWYCYEQTSGMKYFEEDGTTGYDIKVCPFYTHIKYNDIPKKHLPNWLDEEFLAKHGDEYESWCKLIKTDIMDQCKSCNERTNR